MPIESEIKVANILVENLAIFSNVGKSKDLMGLHSQNFLSDIAYTGRISDIRLNAYVVDFDHALTLESPTKREFYFEDAAKFFINIVRAYIADRTPENLQLVLNF